MSNSHLNIITADDAKRLSRMINPLQQPADYTEIHLSSRAVIAS